MQTSLLNNSLWILVQEVTVFQFYILLTPFLLGSISVHILNYGLAMVKCVFILQFV